jgi:hypothetical protein
VAQYDSFSATSGLLQMLRTLCLCHLGQYTDALQQAELGLASVRQHQPGYENHALLRLATCWWHLGQWSRMAPLLADPRMDQGMPMSARTQQALLQWRYARATDASGTAVERARQRMEALLPEVGDEQRPDLRLPLHVELASALAPQQALQELERVCAEAERIRYQGIVLAARIRAAAAGAVCDPPRGRREALAALALAQTHGTTVLLPAELWLHAGRALVAAGDAAHGAEVWAQGRDWLLDKARHQVQEPFRESFLQRVAVNRELMATASSSA